MSISKQTIQYHSQSVNSVAQLYPTLCNSMNCSTPGLPVHHQLPEFTQTHVHRVSDAIQPFHPLLSHSTPAFNLSHEWFALETNRDHCVIFETASKYCILDSSVDFDGYSISSKGFLHTVVDIMVISLKFTHFSPFLVR